MAYMTSIYNLYASLYQLFVTLPVNALTIPRQQKLLTQMPAANEHEQEVVESPYKIGNRLYEWCLSSESVSSYLAADPSLAPGEAWKKLFGHVNNLSHGGNIRDIGKDVLTNEELRKTRFCGKWGANEPSDLFLRMYHDALCTLNDNPAYGMVSPSLMGSTGTMPLTIISVIPDIVRHMSNLIVRAEDEVFLATNFWQKSVASTYITNAIRELSRRAGERGVRVVVKIIYDRGSLKQIFEPHYLVPESEYTGSAVGLPAAREIPNVDLQVMNYHQPLLGTFHSKYMVVDRRIGILQSNNIQDNDNLEMMVHVEGPIVDSLYDMALLSWHQRFEPPLPRLTSPAADAFAGGDVGSFTERFAGIFSPEGTIKGHSAIVDPRKAPNQPKGENNVVHREFEPRTTGNATGPGDGGNIIIPRSQQSEYGCANRDNNAVSHTPESNGANIGREAPKDLGLPTPPCSREGDQPLSQTFESFSCDDFLPEHTADDPHYDADIAGEVFRVQAAVSARPGETSMQAVTRHLNHTVNAGFSSGDDMAGECDPADEMTPYVPHPAHAPFPMALVCRPPYGPPNHRAIECPQNAAWLSALRNARESVFIQSPTLNAEPLVPAIVEACERGVDVVCYICLGYNDAGELLPMQGGHNEMISHRLHASLSARGRPHLRWHWYVAKDQARPIVAGRRRRSCHIKLLIADGRVAVVGNGNMDTQSWFHSQEVNVMLESPDVCAAWLGGGLRRNQNTGTSCGRVDPRDGVWRDARGGEVEGAMGADPGRFSWAKGLVGAVKRVRGTGGF
ncbi:hypothetical protein F5X99DRAFT_408132 [Biscogniauxia marginata]|nr:hypothetical protein F5X99DRAFT_408132 [Biscogniauxia marginata]